MSASKQNIKDKTTAVTILEKYLAEKNNNIEQEQKKRGVQYSTVRQLIDKFEETF